jgi:hypothetical protein
MRTITSTFNSRAEAELASRRLAKMGIPPDRIILREISGDAGAGGAAGGQQAAVESAVLSAKVAPDQMQAATAIMKGLWTAEAAPPRDQGKSDDANAATRPVGEAAQAGHGTDGLISPGSVRFDDTVRPDRAAANPVPEQPRTVRRGHPATDARAVAEPARGSPVHRGGAAAANPRKADATLWGRYLVYYALFLVAIFIFGAALGLIS